MLEVRQGIPETCSTIIVIQSRPHGSAEEYGFAHEDSGGVEAIKLIEELVI